jgi:hypothetical protein
MGLHTLVVVSSDAEGIRSLLFQEFALEPVAAQV